MNLQDENRIKDIEMAFINVDDKKFLSLIKRYGKQRFFRHYKTFCSSPNAGYSYPARTFDILSDYHLDLTGAT